MQMTAVIDRFEGDAAVLLAGDKEDTVRWPRKLLPQGAKEGDILRLSFAIDAEATRQAKNEADDLLRQLLNSQKED